MAVTKIWPIKGRVDKVIDYARNPEKTRESSYDRQVQLHTIDGVIEYAANEDKTEKKFFVSTLNCNKRYARDEFLTVKKQFNKEGGIVAFHGYQSFAGHEVTPEQAHEIGVQLARELWGDRFQVVVATHLNTANLHNHFISAPIRGEVNPVCNW